MKETIIDTIKSIKVNPYLVLFVGLILVLAFFFIIFSTNKWEELKDINDLEIIRLNNLEIYSEILNEIQINSFIYRENINELNKELEHNKRMLEGAIIIEERVKDCLKMNSLPGVVTDCDIYFANLNQDERID